MEHNGGKIRSERRVWHIYQRARHGFVVFYNTRDCLVFFTIFSIKATRHNIKVLGLCLMFNHIHIIVEAPDNTMVAAFMRDVMSRFAMLYNNPVEDGLCRKAEEWQWNFLAYAQSACPFSDKLTLKRATKKLRRSTEQARDLRKSGCILGYEAIDSLCKELDATEKKQMTDYIINLYSVINFSSTTSFYGNYSKMSRAFESNTGSEYDIAESYENHSGPSYRKMSQYASKDIYSLLCQPIESREKYLAELLQNCKVKRLHAMRFLHIDSEEAK